MSGAVVQHAGDDLIPERNGHDFYATIACYAEAVLNELPLQLGALVVVADVDGQSIRKGLRHIDALAFLLTQGRRSRADEVVNESGSHAGSADSGLLCGRGGLGVRVNSDPLELVGCHGGEGLLPDTVDKVEETSVYTLGKGAGGIAGRVCACGLVAEEGEAQDQTLDCALETRSHDVVHVIRVGEVLCGGAILRGVLEEGVLEVCEADSLGYLPALDVPGLLAGGHEVVSVGRVAAVGGLAYCSELADKSNLVAVVLSWEDVQERTYTLVGRKCKEYELPEVIDRAI